jgi:hypothetical protein
MVLETLRPGSPVGTGGAGGGVMSSSPAGSIETKDQTNKAVIKLLTRVTNQAENNQGRRKKQHKKRQVQPIVKQVAHRFLIINSSAKFYVKSI